MGKMIVLLFVLLLVAGGVYVWVFEREWLLGEFDRARQGVQEAAGNTPVDTTPARTPAEALTKFRDAVKARDYEAAANFCGGDYAELMRKAAPAAGALATAVDQLEASIGRPELRSDGVTFWLRWLEPFPTHFIFGEVQPQGEGRGRVGVFEELNLPPGAGKTHGEWNVDPLMRRVLARDWKPVLDPRQPGVPPTVPVELKREGEGNETCWKLQVPVTADTRKAVDRLIEKHPAYVKALEGVRKQVKDDKFARAADLELELKKAVEAAK